MEAPCRRMIFKARLPDGGAVPCGPGTAAGSASSSHTTTSPSTVLVRACSSQAVTAWAWLASQHTGLANAYTQAKIVTGDAVRRPLRPLFTEQRTSRLFGAFSSVGCHLGGAWHEDRCDKVSYSLLELCWPEGRGVTAHGLVCCWLLLLSPEQNPPGSIADQLCGVIWVKGDARLDITCRHCCG
jgi:hypothetical protein